MLNRNGRLALLLRNLERPMFHVAFDIGIIDLATNETFCVEDGIFGVRMMSILGAITDSTNRSLGKPRPHEHEHVQSLIIRKRYP